MPPSKSAPVPFMLRLLSLLGAEVVVAAIGDVVSPIDRIEVGVAF
jgi:hypothetical protein